MSFGEEVPPDVSGEEGEDDIPEEAGNHEWRYGCCQELFDHCESEVQDEESRDAQEEFLRGEEELFVFLEMFPWYVFAEEEESSCEEEECEWWQECNPGEEWREECDVDAEEEEKCRYTDCHWLDVVFPQRVVPDGGHDTREEEYDCSREECPGERECAFRCESYEPDSCDTVDVLVWFAGEKCHGTQEYHPESEQCKNNQTRKRLEYWEDETEQCCYGERSECYLVTHRGARTGVFKKVSDLERNMHVDGMARKGWSKTEIRHAKKLIAKAETVRTANERRIELLGYWLVIFLLAVGVMAVSIEVVPLLVLADLAVSLPIVALLGVCFGLLLAHVMHEHRPHRAHHHAGLFALLVIAFVGVVLILGNVAAGFGLGFEWVVWIASVFVLGTIVPYLVHWRAVRGPA